MSKLIHRCILLVSFLTIVVYSNGQRLSPQAEISLVTASPGTQLYSGFGHSALRVNDPVLGFDIFYNYGTFDFDDPNFYVKFYRGKLPYKLSVYDFKYMPLNYEQEYQVVEEFVINLNQEEKQWVFEFLIENNRPENQYYKYDFFFDNCATRIRDIFDDLWGESIQYSYEKFPEEAISFRDLIDGFHLHNRWRDLGLDLVLGLPNDRKATNYELMCMPKYMAWGLENATIKTKADSITRPFVKTRKILINGQKPIPSFAANMPPFLFFFIFFLIAAGASYWGWKTQRYLIWFDRIYFGLLGLLGILFVSGWAFTDHPSLVWNFDILWAWPTHLFVVFIMHRRSRPLIRAHFWFTLAANGLLLILWVFIPEDMNEGILPLAMVAALRSAMILFQKKRELVKT